MVGGSAAISDCGHYRFRLSRWWGDPDNPDRAVFVMLNPSTADATADDPTIRRCIGFAKAAGCAGLEVVNLFPWRATSPRDLAAAIARGEDCALRTFRDEYISGVVASTLRLPIAAWGAHPAAATEVQGVARLSAVWLTLGCTKDGHPRHPLYLRNDTALEPRMAHELVGTWR